MKKFYSLTHGIDLKLAFPATPKETNEHFSLRFYGIAGYENDSHIAEKFHEEIKAIHAEADRFDEDNYFLYSTSKPEMIADAEIMAATELFLEVPFPKAVSAISANDTILSTDTETLILQAATRYAALKNMTSKDRCERTFFQPILQESFDYLLFMCDAIDQTFYEKMKTAMAFDILSHLPVEAKINIVETDSFDLYFREYTVGIKRYIANLHVEELVRLIETKQSLTPKLELTADGKEFFKSLGFSDEDIAEAEDVVRARIRNSILADCDYVSNDDFFVNDSLENGCEYV